MFRQYFKEETSPPTSQRGRTRFLFRPLSLLVWVVIPLLALPSASGAEGPPLRVRLSGKLYFVPTGEPGRHGDLLAFGIAEEEEVYLQVDEFHTTSRTQSELAVLRAMRRHKPNLRIINAEILAPLLTEEHIRKPVLLAGFFYRMSGRLALVSAFLEEEEETPPARPAPKPQEGVLRDMRMKTAPAVARDPWPPVPHSSEQRSCGILRSTPDDVRRFLWRSNLAGKDVATKTLKSGMSIAVAWGGR